MFGQFSKCFQQVKAGILSAFKNVVSGFICSHNKFQQRNLGLSIVAHYFGSLGNNMGKTPPLFTKINKTEHLVKHAFNAQKARHSDLSSQESAKTRSTS